MGMKCIVTDVVSDWGECITMEEAEDWFRNGRFIRVMKGLDDYFMGQMVPEYTPLGYVEETEGLFSVVTFSEYAKSEGV